MTIERRPWSGVEKVLFGIYTAWFALGVLIFATEDPAPSGFSFNQPSMYLGLSLCYLIPLSFWRPGYMNRTLFALSVLLTTGASELHLSYLTNEPVQILLIPILLVGFMSDRFLIWWTFPVFIIGIPLTAIFVADYANPISTFLNNMGLELIFFAVGFGAQRIVASHHRTKALLDENIHAYKLIQEQNNVLEQYASQVAQLTLLEERNRLARELHDTVGHTFTSVIMGMDAVSFLMDSAPDKARAKLDVLRELTRKGLDEVRRSIHQIAPDDDGGPLSGQLSKLANDFAVHTGTNVRLEVKGPPGELAKQAQLTLVRCLQESLTNAKRHGLARTILAELIYRDEVVELVVEDDGVGSDGLEKGFGLSAMTERLATLRGTLHVESKPGQGTRVRCIVPLQTG